MTYKDVTNIAMFSIIALFALTSFGISNAFAENEYKMIGDTKSVLTFDYRDGQEILEFPVFNMGENFVSNSGVSFTVEGTVTNSPMLHEALDEAYKYRFSNNALDYQFKYFDVDADFVKDGESVVSFDYRNCRIDNYRIETLDSNDYESYFREIGFSITNKVDFVCSGVNSDNPSPAIDSFTDFGESGFNFANNMKTTVTFAYDDGVEKIEFPVFDLVSAYEENPNQPEFYIEGVLDYYPLLYRSIDQSRDVSGISLVSNPDFDALVEFSNENGVMRGFDFKDCVVSDAKITTLKDKEEGFVGKSGFVVSNQFNIRCAGFDPINTYYDELFADTPVWKMHNISNEYVEPIQNTDQGLSAIATFTFPDGTETIEFSMFKQNEILTSTEYTFGGTQSKSSGKTPEEFTRKAAYPTMELRGIVGDYPLLYNYVDNDNLKTQNIGGTQYRTLVDVDVDIISDGEVIRGFNYQGCRVTNYHIDTNAQTEESYVKNKFALENIFDLECQGYHPNNPAYDAMFSTEQVNIQSTNDLRNTDDWAKGFYVE